MKLRLFAALTTFSLLAVLSPAWAQQTDMPGLDGFWYSCANPSDNFDLVLEKHEVLFDKKGKTHSAKYHLEGTQLKFAGRTLVMTDGELDEGSVHWVNGESLLATHCPGSAPQNSATSAANASAPVRPAARPFSSTEPAAAPQSAEAAQAQQETQAPQAPPMTAMVLGTAPTAATTPSNGLSSLDLVSLQQTANAGNSAAQAELGSRYLSGKGLPRDYAIGLAWSRKAADQGNARGQYLVGLCSANGWAANKDEKEALQWWQKSADQGNAEAEFSLAEHALNVGQQYSTGSNGLGLKILTYGLAPYTAIPFDMKARRENKRGEKLMQSAAEQGHTGAEIFMGNMALHHHQDEVAVLWFKKAADQGDLAAYVSLGDLYYNGGKKFTKDPTQSAEWYRKAGEKNMPAAEDKLGDLYRDGVGVPKDTAQAISWYDKAASEFQSLGDNGHAAEVRKKEAQLGDSNADRELGKMYQQGLGVQQDKQQAANWFAKAVVDGNPAASADLAAVQQEIARDQAAQAAQAQEEAKNKSGSDRGFLTAMAGLATASMAHSAGASDTQALQAGLNTAAAVSKITSTDGGQDPTTALLTGAAQVANGQATNPIQQTANEQSAAILRTGAQAAAQRGQTQQAAQASQLANTYQQRAGQQPTANQNSALGLGSNHAAGTGGAGAGDVNAPGSGPSSLTPAQAKLCIKLWVKNDVINVTNNCGEYIEMTFVQPGDPSKGYQPQSIDINFLGGETYNAAGLTGLPYRYWACLKASTPIDTNTNASPTYQSTNVVCK
jgi:TPR repeat protein